MQLRIKWNEMVGEKNDAKLLKTVQFLCILNPCFSSFNEFLRLNALCLPLVCYICSCCWSIRDAHLGNTVTCIYFVCRHCDSNTGFQLRGASFIHGCASLWCQKLPYLD